MQLASGKIDLKKNVKTEEIKELQVLVQELSKKKPNSELIKNQTSKLGIPFNNDLIIQMSEVLVYLSRNTKKA